MLKRIISAIVLIICFVPSFFVGGLYLKIVQGIIMAIATYELLKLFDGKFSIIEKAICYILFLASFLLGLINIKYSILTILLFIIVFFVISLLDERVDLFQISFLTLLIVLLNSFFYGLNIIIENKQLMLIILVGTYLTDAAALFVGMAIGKHKLNVRISPNKTIEGFIGGYLISMIINVVIAILSKQTNWQIITICLLTPLLGQIGDLAFSEIKRNFKIKDFGNLIPGHGGVLDRIDSFIFNVIVALIILRVM